MMDLPPQQAVYRVESDRSDPRGEGFAISISEPSLLGIRGWHSEGRTRDFYPSFPVQADWIPPTLSQVWRPLRVSGRVRAWNDFPMVMEVPAFSERAVAALRDILEANGELLSLEYEHGTWFAYNCRTVAHVVDYQTSTFAWNKDVRKEINHYVIHEQRLVGLTVFRMRENPSPTMYATQLFVDRVREAGLRNFLFKRIWPWPEGTIWYLEDKKLRRQEKDRERAADLRRHSVVIRLVTGNKSKPTKRQREHVEKMMDSLDQLLADPYAPHDAPVYGNLEGD